MINVAVLSYESTARKKLTRFLDNLACNHESLGHLIIVNNNPNNNISLTALPHKLFKRMTIINMGYNSGYAEGMNTAIRKSFQLSPQSPLILCNDDVYLTCKFLLKFDEAVRKLSSVLLENKIGVMGVTIRDRKNKMIMHAGKKLKKWTYQFKNAYKNESDKEYVFVNYISGAIWGCLPSSIIEFDLLDQNYFMYYEMYDFQKRLRENDFYNVWFPKIDAFHDCQKKEIFSLLVLYYAARNKLFFLKRTLSFIQFLLYLPVYFYKLYIYNVLFLHKFESIFSVLYVLRMAFTDFMNGDLGKWKKHSRYDTSLGVQN